LIPKAWLDAIHRLFDASLKQRTYDLDVHRLSHAQYPGNASGNDMAGFEYHNLILP
jgi:hypothetical protein